MVFPFYFFPSSLFSLPSILFPPLYPLPSSILLPPLYPLPSSTLYPPPSSLLSILLFPLSSTFLYPPPSSLSSSSLYPLSSPSVPLSIGCLPSIGQIEDTQLFRNYFYKLFKERKKEAEKCFNNKIMVGKKNAKGVSDVRYMNY